MMSMIEGGSGNDPVEDNAIEQQPLAKKKRLHRHTARQIQEMEAYVLPFFFCYYENLLIMVHKIMFTTN